MKNTNYEEQLIFQIARFISIWDVYQNLIKYGNEGKFLINYQFTKDNTIILVLSNLYALFDEQKKAQSLEKIKFTNDEVESLKTEIVKQWEEIKNEIKIIRHNLGFHTTKNIEGQMKALEQFEKLGEKPFILINKIIKLYFIFISLKNDSKILN